MSEVLEFTDQEAIKQREQDFIHAFRPLLHQLTRWMPEQPLPCRENEDIFFYENNKGKLKTGDEKTKDIEEAKSICNSCNFREKCLESALENNEQYGIWGATTTEERSALKKRPRL